MTIHRFIAEPIRSFSGALLGVEVLTRFSKDGKQLRDTESIIYHLGSDRRLSIFKEQIELIAQKQDYFIRNDIQCSINVDMDTISLLNSDIQLQKKVKRMAFLKLELYEKIHFLHDGVKNPLLKSLSLMGQELWMDDFGSSEADIISLKSMYYSAVKIDRLYYLKHIQELTFHKTIENIRNICGKIIVEGVEDETHLEGLRNFNIWGVQGYIYPAVDLLTIENNLTT